MKWRKLKHDCSIRSPLRNKFATDAAYRRQRSGRVTGKDVTQRSALLRTLEKTLFCTELYAAPAEYVSRITSGAERFYFALCQINTWNSWSHIPEYNFRALEGSIKPCVANIVCHFSYKDCFNNPVLAILHNMCIRKFGNRREKSVSLMLKLPPRV